jgi:DNA-binding transcriptional ArsR family regulator
VVVDMTTRAEQRLRVLEMVFAQVKGDLPDLLSIADECWKWVSAPVVPQAETASPVERPAVEGGPAQPPGQTAPPTQAEGSDTPAAIEASPQLARVLAAVDELAGTPVSAVAIARRLGISALAVRHHLTRLVRAGVLVVAGATNRRTWRRPGTEPVDRGSERELQQRATILQRLTAAAEAGEPCPSNAVLAAAIGVSKVALVSDIVATLAHEGAITVDRRDGNTRRVTIAATGASTAWSQIPRHTVPEARVERVYELLAAAAAQGSACPTNDEVVAALGEPIHPATVSKIVVLIEAQGRIQIERRGAFARRVVIVATGAATGWSGKAAQLPAEEPPPCAPSEPAPSPLDPPSHSLPVSTSPSGDAISGGSDDAPPVALPAPPTAGRSDDASTPLPAAAPVVAEPPAPVVASAAASSPPSGSDSTPAAPRGSTGAAAASPRASSSPAASTGPRPSSRPHDPLAAPVVARSRPAPEVRPEERAAIEAAVAAGKVTRAPVGKSGIVMRSHKGVVMEAPTPFPDASPAGRAAAIYLQSRGVVVVTNGPGKYLLDARWSVREPELIERANKKRAAQKLPPITADGVAA